MLFLPTINQCAFTATLHTSFEFTYASISVLTADMEAFNKSMSAVRVSVEWLVGDVINYFRFLDFKKI